MEYRLRIDDNVTSFSMRKGDGDSITLTRGDLVLDLRYSVISEHHLFIILNGVGYNAYLSRDGKGRNIVIRGIPFYIEDADRPTAVRKKNSAVQKDVTPPMPSVVVRILAAAGDHVKKGSGVIVVTAMKMETTLAAPYDGTVKSVNVSVGDKVMPGQILVDILEFKEPPPGGEGDAG